MFSGQRTYVALSLHGLLRATGKELLRSHNGQIKIDKAFGVAGYDKIGICLQGGEVLHGIFKVGRTRIRGSLY